MNLLLKWVLVFLKVILRSVFDTEIKLHLEYDFFCLAFTLSDDYELTITLNQMYHVYTLVR